MSAVIEVIKGIGLTIQQIFQSIVGIFDFTKEIFSDILQVGISVFATQRSVGYFLVRAMPTAIAYIFLVFITVNIVLRIAGRDS